MLSESQTDLSMLCEGTCEHDIVKVFFPMVIQEAIERSFRKVLEVSYVKPIGILQDLNEDRVLSFSAIA